MAQNLTSEIAPKEILADLPEEREGVPFERKSFLRLTLPLFFYGFLSIIATFVDQILLSAYSQDLAATVSIANQVLGVTYDLSTLFSVGALVLIAQFLGRDDVASARKIASVAIFANTALSVGIATVLWAGGHLFVTWVKTPPELVADATLYIHIIAFAMIGNGFLTAAAAVLRAFGHTVEILILGLIGSFLYIGLEYVLIFGKLGLPELGVRGAALSTLIIRGIGVVFLLLILHYRLGIRLWPAMPFSAMRRVMKRIASLSLPSVGDNFAFNLYQLAMLSLITVLGMTSVLTRTYVNTATAFLAVIAIAISHGNEILVGYDKGASQTVAARERASRTAGWSALLSMGLAVLLWIFSDPLIGLFTKDPVVLAEARTVLLIQIFLQPFMTSNMVLFNALRAVGDVVTPVAYSLVVTWSVALPLGWLAVKSGLGVPGLWLAMLTAEVIRSGIFGVRWLRMRWIKYTPTEGAL